MNSNYMSKAREREREKIKNLTSNIIYYFSHCLKNKKVKKQRMLKK